MTSPRSPVGHARELTLLLTGDCNLRCAYCYQNQKRPGSIAWPVVRAALDALLGSPHDPRALSFAGGEPTLQFDLIRRAVAYVADHCQSGRAIQHHIVTNGTLLERRDYSFLREHDVRLEISLDGVEEAQDVRARGTFRRLDWLLDDLRSQCPEYFGRRVTVAMTIARATIPHIADSLEYLRSKRVRNVALQPALGEADWDDGDIAQLDSQFARLVDVCAARLTPMQPTPLVAFRPESPRPRSRSAWGCTAPLGNALAVDVDGLVYPCPVFARSNQRFAPQLDARVRQLSMGDVRDPRLSERLEQLPDACRASGLFGPKRLQHSGGRSCATCRERRRCIVCPLARARGGDPDDLNDIPRYLCAYERVLARHRRRFLARAAQTPGMALLSQMIGARRQARGTRD